MLLKTEQVVGLGIQVAPRAEKGKEMDSGIKVSDIRIMSSRRRDFRSHQAYFIEYHVNGHLFIYKAGPRWNEAILLLVGSNLIQTLLQTWYFYSVLKMFPCSDPETNLARILIHKGMWLPKELMPS